MSIFLTQLHTWNVKLLTQIVKNHHQITLETKFPRGENVWSSYRIQNEAIRMGCSGVSCHDLEKGFGRVLTFTSLSCCLQTHQLLEKYMVGVYTKQTTLLDYQLMWVPDHCFRANPNDAASTTGEHADSTWLLIPWLHFPDSISVPSWSSKNQSSNIV